MHTWGTEGVDWKGIEDAADYIGCGLRKYWRVPVMQWKEKYGTVRVYNGFGWSSIHDIFYAGYAYNQWGTGFYGSEKPGPPDTRPIWKKLLFYLSYAQWFNLVFRKINLVVIPTQRWAYRRYYRKALKRWPHLREEILSCADWSELLEGL